MDDGKIPHHPFFLTSQPTRIADKDATIAADKTTIANLMALIAELEEQNKP